MRQSQYPFSTRKEAPKDETSQNAQLLIRAGFIDKLMAGVYTFLPLGLRVLRKIEAIIREEMEAVGGQEILMPALQPKSNWEATERWEKLDSLFRFTSYYTHNEYALGPTHEEVVTPLVAKLNLSYKDLPFALFQIQNKFRDEPRAKSGILRGREFVMKDLYSFHATEEDLDRYYEEVKKAYHRIFKRIGIGAQTHLTFASGGTFSQYSHEFQTIAGEGEDTIFLCAKCDVAVNKEISGEIPKCPVCNTEHLEIHKAIEVGNIFKLKTKYSHPFSLTYQDNKGDKQEVTMGCYGIGPSRLVGTVVEAFHDEKGMQWPQSVAPYTIHLLRIGEGDALNKYAEEVYNGLSEKGIEVLYDDRALGAGEKFADADLIGIPWRAVISEKTIEKKEIELKARNEKEPTFCSQEKIISHINK